MTRGRALQRLLFSSALALIPASVSARSPSVGVTALRSAQALDCPDGAELEAQVAQILQHSLTDSAAPGGDVRIQVEFSRSGEGYVAEVLFLGSKPGERVLRDRGEQCSALAQAVSVTIALFLDQELAENNNQRSTPTSPARRRRPFPARRAPVAKGRPWARPRRGAGKREELWREERDGSRPLLLNRFWRCS